MLHSVGNFEFHGRFILSTTRLLACVRHSHLNFSCPLVKTLEFLTTSSADFYFFLGLFFIVG